jgi:hypothetical protein
VLSLIAVPSLQQRDYRDALLLSIPLQMPRAMWAAKQHIVDLLALQLKLLGFDRALRFVVLWEEIEERKPSRSRKLFAVPGCSFRAFVTNFRSCGTNLTRLQPEGLRPAAH